MEPSDDKADGRVSDPHTSRVMGFDAAGGRTLAGFSVNRRRQVSPALLLLSKKMRSLLGRVMVNNSGFRSGGRKKLVKNELLLFLTLEGDLLLFLLGPTAPLLLLGGVRVLQLSLTNHR